jgi:hypothetical protein
MFDFFDEPVGARRRLLEGIEQHGIKVIVVCSQQEFSGRDRDLEAALAERFPESAKVGRFEVAVAAVRPCRVRRPLVE